jgi:hypothetical protein
LLACCKNQHYLSIYDKVKKQKTYIVVSLLILFLY